MVASEHWPLCSVLIAVNVTTRLGLLLGADRVARYSSLVFGAWDSNPAAWSPSGLQLAEGCGCPVLTRSAQRDCIRLMSSAAVGVGQT